MEKVTLDQILNTPLSLFDNNCINTGVSDSRYRKIPNNIIKWNNFENELLNFKSSRLELNGPAKYHPLLPPPHRGKYVFEEEADVKGTLKQTLFSVIIDIFDQSKCKIDITNRSLYGPGDIVAEPDMVAWRYSDKKSRKHLLLPIEIKKPDKENSDLYREYFRLNNHHTDSKKIIQQIVGYMCRNKVSYGIITTYQEIYALYLKDDGILHMTRPYKYNETDIGAISVLWYTLHKAIKAKPYRGPELQDAHRNPSPLSFDSANVNSASSKSLSNITPQIVGGSKKNKDVYSIKLDQKEVTVKTARNKTRESAMIKNEVKIYNHLSKLQGVYIPKLLKHGTHNDQTYMITEKCGDNIRWVQKGRNLISSILNAVDAIHKLGVCHGDLELRNILLFNKQIFIIDFEESIINGSAHELEDEMSTLIYLLHKTWLS